MAPGNSRGSSHSQGIAGTDSRRQLPYDEDLRNWHLSSSFGARLPTAQRSLRVHIQTADPCLAVYAIFREHWGCYTLRTDFYVIPWCISQIPQINYREFSFAGNNNKGKKVNWYTPLGRAPFCHSLGKSCGRGANSFTSGRIIAMRDYLTLTHLTANLYKGRIRIMSLA